MSRVSPTVLLALVLGILPVVGHAAPCPVPDNQTLVTGDKECLVIKTFRSPGALAAPTLFVVLHGDSSYGGPSDYHYAVAEKLAESGQTNLVAVALVRPGYADSSGHISSGSTHGRKDNYTADNVDDVAGAIATLKSVYKASRVILIGHSGGAAIAGVILGRHPGLADAAVLVSCPCDVRAWRKSKSSQPWPRSESPSHYVDRVPKSARIAIVVGAMDTDVPPAISQALCRRTPGPGHCGDLNHCAEGLA